MDIRKAIAMIGHIREYIVDNQDDHEYAEPIDMAIEALKKLIPKSALNKGPDGHVCPICNYPFYEEPYYCMNCGQKISERKNF